MYIHTVLRQSGLRQAAEDIAARLSFGCGIYMLNTLDWKIQVDEAKLDTPNNFMIQFDNMDQELFMYATEVNGKEVLRMYTWGCPDGLDRYDDPKKRKFISHGEIPIGLSGEGIDDAVRHALRVLFEMSLSVDPIKQRLKKLEQDWPLEKRAN